MILRISSFLLLFLLCWGGAWRCDAGCLTLSTKYNLSGCLGDDQCTVTQTDCQIQIDCQKILQYCQGYMIGREINMRCAALDGHFFQAIVGSRETELSVTFVKDSKTCQGKWTPG